MAKDQQANQAQGMIPTNRPPSVYNPAPPGLNPTSPQPNTMNQMMTAQGNLNSQAQAQNQMMAQQPGLATWNNLQGMPSPQRPASSYPKFQEALGNYFKQNPGSFTEHMNARYPRPVPFRDQVMSTGFPPIPNGGQAADPRNAGGPRGPRPSGNRNKVSVPTQDTRNRGRGLAAGIRGRNSGRNDLNSGILQGPSSFAPNSPYSNRNR